MKKKLIAALVGTVLVASVPAFAHTDKYFDSKTAPHGGQQRMTGPYHVELVAGPGELTVYLANHADGAMPTAGGEGKAVVRTKEGATTVLLSPAGENTLKGKGEFTLDAESTVTVFVKMPGQEAWAAKFIPLQPKTHASQDEIGHGHHDGGDDDDDDAHEHHH